jgi:hypothetical protein
MSHAPFYSGYVSAIAKYKYKHIGQHRTGRQRQPRAPSSKPLSSAQSQIGFGSVLSIGAGG